MAMQWSATQLRSFRPCLWPCHVCVPQDMRGTPRLRAAMASFLMDTFMQVHGVVGSSV